MASSTNNENIEKERSTPMYEGKNIHSSPVDGKLLCSFSEKTCMQRRLNRYAFCIRHVLEDKNSPFKQCKFVAKYNGQRCTNAIPLREDRMWVSLLDLRQFLAAYFATKSLYKNVLYMLRFERENFECFLSKWHLLSLYRYKMPYWFLSRLDTAIVICKS